MCLAIKYVPRYWDTNGIWHSGNQVIVILTIIFTVSDLLPLWHLSINFTCSLAVMSMYWSHALVHSLLWNAKPQLCYWGNQKQQWCSQV